MYNCPSCKQPSISGAKKWWSNVSYAECPNCKALSHVPASSANGIFALSVVFVVLGFIGMVYTQSVLVVVAGVIAALASYPLLWHRAELIPISRERAATERQVSLAAAALAAIMSIFN